MGSWVGPALCGGRGTALVEFGDQAPKVRAELDRFLTANLDQGG